jgi:predicted Zn-dependent protease
MVALILAVAFVVVAMTGLRAVVLSTGTFDGRPLSAADGSTPVPAGSEIVLVQPGQTLWTIARGLQPSGDVRPLVDELAALNGGATLEAGQNLVLPG